MSISSLSQLLVDNIDTILNNELHYKSIISMDNRLIGFNILNRMLIEIQQGKERKITDLKTEDEWAIVGRKLTNENNYIEILIPYYSCKYKDSDTGREIRLSEFNGKDRLKALEMGIIKKESSFESIRIHRMYDIYDTKGVTKVSKYKMQKPMLSIERLLRLMSDITEFRLISNELTKQSYIDLKNKVVSIGKVSYSELALSTSDILAVYYTDKFSDELSKEQRKFLELSLKYSLCTLFLTKRHISIFRDSELEFEQKLHVLCLIDSIHEEVISNIEFINKDTDNNIVERITRYKKAESLWNIMLADSISSRLSIN